MRFVKLSAEALAELKRPRTVDEKELEQLTRQVLQHLVTFQNRIKRHEWGGSYPLTWKQEATERAFNYVLTRILNEWKHRGTATPWLAHENYFAACFKDRMIDVWKSNTVPDHRPNAQEEAEETTKRVHGQASIYRPDSSGKIDADAELAYLTHKRSGSYDDFEAATMLTVAVAIIPQIVEVLSSRTGHSGLSEKHAELARFMTTLEMGAKTLDEADLALLPGMANLDTWRARLAAAWLERAVEDHERAVAAGKATGPAPSAPRDGEVHDGLNRVVRLIKICLYLFIRLAPPQHVVARQDRMHALLDLVYASNRTLQTARRKALEVAGGSTVALRATSMIRVDEELFIQQARRLTRFGMGWQDSDLLALLHEAEDEYASQVPDQIDPPSFWCVFECPTHLPQSPEGKTDE